MITKFNLGQELYYFDPNREEITSAAVEMILINEDGTFYRVGNEELTLPERQLYSCELQCVQHFREVFWKKMDKSR